MKIDIKGLKVSLTPALREHINTKLARIERHFDRITSINITLDKEDVQKIAEGNVIVPGKTIHARAEDSDMYAAIDALIDKLDRGIKKYKEKLSERT